MDAVLSKFRSSGRYLRRANSRGKQTKGEHGECKPAFRSATETDSRRTGGLRPSFAKTPIPRLCNRLMSLFLNPWTFVAGGLLVSLAIIVTDYRLRIELW